MGNNSFDGNANAEMLLTEISLLLQRRDKIKAIKLYRQITGADLSTAREAIERIEMAIAAGTFTASMDLFAASSSFGAAQATDEPAMLEIQRLIAQRRKIEAIKLYRQITGTDLSEAKANVDRIERTMHQQGF
jgi:ribosomal protein L7/L12